MARPAARPGCLPPVNVAPERVIRTLAGLRPYRAQGFVVRAEALGDKRLVHNYGHGGVGHHPVLGLVPARDPARPSGPSAARSR